MPIKNFNLNHVALSVPRLEDAIKFYTSIFGLRQIRDIMKVKVQGSQPENINTSRYSIYFTEAFFYGSSFIFFFSLTILVVH